jgi:hypothetical protein
MRGAIVLARAKMSNATTNQIQLSAIFAAHYTATRTSIEAWVSRRDQYLNWFLLGAYADIGFFLNSQSHNVWTLYLVAPVTVLIVFAYVGADLHVAYLCRYLNKEYTPILNAYCKQFDVPTYEPWHWDNSLSVKKFYKDGAGLFRYAALILTFCGTNIVAYFGYVFQSNAADKFLMWSSISASIIATVIVVYIYFVRVRMV